MKSGLRHQQRNPDLRPHNYRGSHAAHVWRAESQEVSKAHMRSVQNRTECKQHSGASEVFPT